jgi:fused signal recognition particle receptor
MTFNWFNRAAESEEPTAPKPEESNAPETTAPDPAEALTFAKAAYERLKQKQAAAQLAAQQAEEQKASDESDETEPEVAVSEAVAPETIAPEATPDLAQVAAIESSEPVASEPVVAETEEPAEPIVQPLWMQAQAETEARLEEFRADAIVTEPEPETKAPTKTVEYIYPPDLILDDGFTWGAEVLAAQGRRVEDISLEEITWLKRLRQGLDKTRRNLVNQLKAIVGQGPLNQDAVDEIETLLLQADVGVMATDKIVEALQTKLRAEVLPPEEAIAFLKQLLREMLDAPYTTGGYKRGFSPEKDKLNIWMMTGVNGAGKTTTIGKITHVASKSGYKCLIAAADTFRAAAVEQVKVWGERSGVEVISNPGQNTDPAAVVFDAISAAQSRGTELLLIDTAGRLQNKKNLMDELAKVRRIIDKKVGPDVQIETLLVLDSTLGQNGLQQAKVFSEAAQISGVVLTKLDGTAKGGIALAVVEQLGLPIRFIGAGEGIEDLRPFSGYEFVEALISG